MTLAEYEAYITTIKYPIIEDNKIKKCCKYFIGFSKKYLNNAKKKERTD